MPVSPAMMGAIWMLVSGCCYVGSAVIMRYIGDGYSPYEITFLRAVIAVVILAPVFVRQGRVRLWPERPFAVFMSAVFSYLGILFWFVATAKMPVGDFFAITFITPIITIAFAILFLGERADMRSWAATVAGFIGVLIVLRPGFVDITVGALAAVACSLGYASVNTVIKSLSRTITATAIVFYTNVLMIPISLPMAIMEWRTPLVADLPAIVGIALLSTLGYMLVTKAIAIAPARVVQPVNFMRMPIGAAFGWVLFSEFPDLWTWLGAIAIFAATSYAVQRGTKPD